MNQLNLFAAPIVSLLAAQLAGMDPAVAQKWEAAKVLKYHVEGVHKGRSAVISGDYEGKADVLDRLTVEFTWDNKKGAVVGPIAVTDSKSQLSNIRSDGTNCPPPQLAGEYEYFHSASATATGGGQIQIKGTRTYPAAKVSNYPGSCSMRPIPGATEQTTVSLVATSAQVLGMPNMPGSPITIAADRKSFSMNAGDWVWTFTPTLVQ